MIVLIRTAMSRFKHNNSIGNSGSTLITVIVAIGFVTILTSIILGTSVMNVQMKSMDRRSKDDFYYAEKALNDIYTGLGQETASIAGQQYELAFKNVGMEISGVDYSFSEEAEKAYKKNFISAVGNEVKLSSLDDMKTHFNSYIVPEAKVVCTVDRISGYAYELYNGSTTLSDGTAVTASTAERIRIKGVQVSSVDTRQFKATISTDIIIETPTMDFLGANVDVTDYSLIAEKGLYINGDATINGNVYAGIHADGDVSVDDSLYGAEKLYGGININGNTTVGHSDVKMNGNYIVSKGDINLSGTKPKLTVGREGLADANLPNIYFDTMRTCKGTILDKSEDVIKLNSNVFALNDLELNADNSKVTVAGNYYGYNDMTLPHPNDEEYITDPDAMKTFTREAGHDDSESSAIIVNGSHSTLDMSKIRSLVLMGRAYVDFGQGGAGGESIDGLTKVAPTAEAVALKTNQQLYLVPTDLLESPNPVLSSDYGSGFVLAKVEDGGITKPKIIDWFGYGFVDSTNPFKTYKVTLSDGSIVYYAYLNFNNKLWLKRPTDPNAEFGYIEDESGAVLGTGGSVSSMEAFFDIVMSSKAEHEKIISDAIADGKNKAEAKQEAETYENSMVSPSPYRVYERIMRSMGWEYFDLQDCIIGDGADSAILYSQNAIVEYQTQKETDPFTNEKNVKKDAEGYPIFESKMLENTGTMYRYAKYPQNLYHRYQWLATMLNAHQDLMLETDPNADTRYSSMVPTVKSEWIGSGNGYYSEKDAPPLSHFVALDKIIGKTLDTTSDVGEASLRRLPRNSYGDCIVKCGNLVIGRGKDIITVGDTFKGVAIVDGDITVSAGTTVNGLLMATGVIILEPGVAINYDKGLIQARIEKEMANVKVHPEAEPNPASPGDAYKRYYLITYLTQNRPTGSTDDHRIYIVEPGSKKQIDRIEADYHYFMFYENWKKGPSD